MKMARTKQTSRKSRQGKPLRKPLIVTEMAHTNQTARKSKQGKSLRKPLLITEMRCNDDLDTDEPMFDFPDEEEIKLLGWRTMFRVEALEIQRRSYPLKFPEQVWLERRREIIEKGKRRLIKEQSETEEMRIEREQRRCEKDKKRHLVFLETIKHKKRSKKFPRCWSPRPGRQNFYDDRGRLHRHGWA